MNRIYSFAAFLIIILFFYCEESYCQSSITYFKDTTTRIGSSMAGAAYDNGEYIYIWGDGTGRSSFKVPQVHKIDTSGKEVWNTGNSKLLNEGYIASAYIDSNFIYAVGLFPIQYEASKFYLAKIDKSTGAVLFKKENLNLNAYGLVDVREQGPDSLRVVCYTYDDAQSNPNWPPVYSMSISKLDGNSSEPAPFGLENLGPLFIDKDDMAYYYTASDSLVKYNVAQHSIVWRNKENLAGAFYARPGTALRKEGSKIYLFGDRFCRQIDDNTGNTIWNINIPSRTSEEFWPSDIVFKNDSIYTTWLHPYSGSIDEYGHFSKINKVNGTVYINGTISNTGGINYDSSGYFRSYKIVVDNSNNIFLFGHYYNDGTGQRCVKKFSSNGSFMAENKLSVDTLIPKQNNIIAENNLGYATGFLFNNKPNFLYSKYIFNGDQPSARVCLTKLSTDLAVKTEKFIDNNCYQYSSSVVDIKKDHSHTYVLKKQGLNVYLEKFLAPDSLEWRRYISSDCFFMPVTFSIDSLGSICVIGSSANCAPITDPITLTSKFLINRMVYLDPNGSILKDLPIGGVITNTQLPNLLGTENGFFLSYPGGVLKLDTIVGYELLNTSLPSNFSSGLHNDQSNKIFLTINDVDSVYIFSSRLSSTTDAFYYAVNKGDLSTRTRQLSSSFPIGYLLHAVKSARETNVAYISGLTGQGAYPTIIKLNYKTNTVIWKYSYNKIGEAFKTVEDDSGFVYAVLTRNDTTKIIKLDHLNGNVLWQYSKYDEALNTRIVDLKISNANKMVVVAGLNIVTNYYKPYYLTLNSQTGTLNDIQVIQGDSTEMSFIQAVQFMRDSTIIIGGNLTADLQGGKNGFLLKRNPLNGSPCIDNYWWGTVNNHWETAGNWSCGFVPGPTSNVIINNGSVLLNSNATIYSFTLSPGTSFTINPGFILTILH